ncbi:spore coat protein [Paenibacillus woosongensis]|uniref:Spore coat protein n=1 Tax=Paenibacillus woosongensis TaxID=307580 RepID=A0AA95IDS2_9BACL|nr:spore coat protein [Paenibacillus woosongensis]WHX50583.1 spore coat protein [Paenibacillus woosongensis]
MTSTSQFQNANLLPEEDLLNVILADLKRTVREYTTATTESACPSVRQMFTQLTDSTLQLQGQLFQLLSSQNMYTAPSKATRTEVDKKLQEAQQTQQQLQQFTQQRTAQMSSGSQAPQANMQQNAGNHTYS